MRKSPEALPSLLSPGSMPRPSSEVLICRKETDPGFLPPLLLLCSVMSNSATPWTVAHQVPLSMEFSRQEYRSGLPFPTPRNFPNPGIKLVSRVCCIGRGILTTVPLENTTLYTQNSDLMTTS